MPKTKLQQLWDREEKADLPLKDTAHNLVFGDGSPNAKVLFLGEAPGKNEDLQGLPFIGQAGKVLDSLLEIAGLKRQDVFITSILHYRPPKNRDPKPAEIAAFKPYVDELIKIISPKIIVTLGRHSMNKFLPKAIIGQVHGTPQQITFNDKPITIFPMYHPAAVLYRRNLQKVLEEDFKKLGKLV